MIRIHPLAQPAALSVARVDHPPETPHQDPQEETAEAYELNFVEQGVFEVRARNGQWRFYPGTVFVTWPGLVFQCRHEESIPRDVCLSVTLQPALVREVNVRKGRLPLFFPVSNRLRYLHWRLTERALRDADLLTTETLAAELVEAVAHRDGTRWKPTSPGQLQWYARRVERTRELLESDYAHPHSLGSLAREAGMSPFHFSRVFRELTGTPPHRYLLRVRLARAAERLRDGASVTETCFACGFNNLSHFTRLFRHRFGVSPSRWLS